MQMYILYIGISVSRHTRKEKLQDVNATMIESIWEHYHT